MPDKVNWKWTNLYGNRKTKPVTFCNNNGQEHAMENSLVL